MQGAACVPFSTNPLVIQCLSVDQLFKRQLAKLPTILDSLYTTITNDHIVVEVRGSGEPQSGRFFHVQKLTLPDGLT